MKIYFEINASTLTVEDMLMIEDVQEQKRPVHNMTAILSRYMANEQGELLGVDAAMAVIKPMTMETLTEVVTAFGEAIQRKAIPPTISAAS